MPDLGALIADFLADAATSGLYTREQLRDLRGNLAHVVASDVGMSAVDAIRGRHVQALVRELHSAGVSAERAGAIVEALRPVFAYAVGRGLVRTSSLVGLASAERQAPVADDRDPGARRARRRMDGAGRRHLVAGRRPRRAS
jgi:site-specific recombinase XerC